MVQRFLDDSRQSGSGRRAGLACPLSWICLLCILSKTTVPVFSFGVFSLLQPSFGVFQARRVGVSSRGALDHRTALQSSETDGSDLRGLAEPVEYLPPLDFTTNEDHEPAVGSLVLPCFPMKSLTPVPSTKYEIGISEPRYRQMYNDILMSGGRRFVVPFQHKDSPRSSNFVVEAGGETEEVLLGAVGVVLYLDDLSEVSQETDDEVKYVGRHSAIGRVRIKEVLNPRAFADGLFGPSNYLRLEVEDLDDVDLDDDTSKEESRLADLLQEVSTFQEQCGVVQIQPERVNGFNFTRGSGFWGTLRAWQNHMSNCIVERHRAADRELKQAILSCADLPEEDLQTAVYRKLAAIRSSLKEDVEPFVDARSERIHQIVQSSRHKHRLHIFQTMLMEEKRRLQASLALNDILSD
mmetsp:Transcript_47732/g.137907  ORF Transcript_47732/g.137907 Transcript_47732/m.137907 type:complete len:409 (+) Transcript_47732:46-1272(+)